MRPGFEANVNGGMGLEAKNHSGGAAPDGLGIYGTDGVSVMTANAGTFFERLRVDISGRLLVGTSSTSGVAKLVVKGNTSSDTGVIDAATNLSAGGSIGAGTEIGILRFTDANANRFAHILCEADAASGTNDYPGRLSFSTTADGASSPTEAFRVNKFQELVFPDTSSSWNIKSARPSGAGQGHIVFNNGGSAVGTITTTTTATAYNTSSDYRLKENITPVADGITRLQQLKPSRFNFIANPDIVVDGFIAHEVQAIVPEAIAGEKDAVDDEGNPEYQGIDQSKLVPLLTAALQEAIGRIETLEGMVAVNNITIDEQQHQLSTLAARLTALESA